MENNSIEQSLIEIERNLEKLESARQQVLNVTQSSQQLSEVTGNLIKEFNQIHEVLNNQSASFVQKFKQNEQNLDKKLSEILDKWQQGVNNFLGNIEKTNSRYISDLAKTVDASNSKTKEVSTYQKQYLTESKETQQHLEQSINTFQSKLKNFDFTVFLSPFLSKLEIFTEKSEKQLTENTSKVSDAISQITKLEANIGKQIDEIKNQVNQSRYTLQTEFKEAHDKQQKQIEHMESIINKKSNLNIVLLAIIIIIALANLFF